MTQPIFPADNGAPVFIENWLLSIPGDLCGLENNLRDGGYDLHPTAYGVREHVTALPGDKDWPYAADAKVWRIRVRNYTPLAGVLKEKERSALRYPSNQETFWCDWASGPVRVRLLQCSVVRIVEHFHTVDFIIVDILFKDHATIKPLPVESYLS
jgi:hypothetical protein